MGQNEKTRDHVNGMDDNQLAKIAKKGKSYTWRASKM